MEDSKAFEDENNAINAYFNKPKIPKLDAIIYAEFDNDIGRVVKYQVYWETIILDFRKSNKKFRFLEKFLIDRDLSPSPLP